MSDPFQSPKRRIKRANEHIANLAAGEKEFMFKSFAFEERPSEEEPGFVEVVLRQTAPLPEVFHDWALEAVDALRSALDQACYVAAVRSGKVEPKSAYFPFSDDPDQLENTIKRRCRDLPAILVEMLRAVQPYRGGNHAIWALNKARQSNQHKVCLGTSILSQPELMNVAIPDHGVVSPRFAPWSADKGEAVIAVVSKGVAVKPSLKLSIAFTDAGPLNGLPAAHNLGVLARHVETLVGSIERMSFLINPAG